MCNKEAKEDDGDGYACIGGPTTHPKGSDDTIEWSIVTFHIVLHCQQVV